MDKMTEQEIKKSIEEKVDAFLSTEVESEEVQTEEVVEKSENSEEVVEELSKEEEIKEENVEKSKMASDSSEGGKTDEEAKRDENGGKDKMKSGSPFTEKKSDMKKSQEILGNLSEDEIDLVLAWRAEESSEVESENSEEIVEKSLKEGNESTLLEEIKKSFKEETQSLRKSIEEKDDLIKSLSDKVEKLSNQPAYDSKGIDTLEAIEKSEVSTPKIGKKQVLDQMLNMIQEGNSDVNSHHVAEFEATGNISNPKIKNLILEKLK